VLSLGSGRPGITPASSLRTTNQDAINAMAILQAERTAEELDNQIGRSRVYYRFSVDRGLESPESVSLGNIGDIEAHTQAYLQQSSTGYVLDRSTTASEHAGLVTTKDICTSPAAA
jgi:hypothetical protein